MYQTNTVSFPDKSELSGTVGGGGAGTAGGLPAMLGLAAKVPAYNPRYRVYAESNDCRSLVTLQRKCKANILLLSFSGNGPYFICNCILFHKLRSFLIFQKISRNTFIRHFTQKFCSLKIL